MKLYLSSIDIPAPAEFQRLVTAGRLVLVIPNAWDKATTARSQPAIDTCLANLTQLGYRPRLIDLNDRLPRVSSDLGAIWTLGGNSFILSYLMQKTNFKAWLQPLLEDGVVYGGESAGAVLAGPTLRGVQILDDPAEAVETVWEGLGLIESGIIPHWDNQKYSTSLATARKEMDQYCPTITLNDADVLIIEGGQQKVVSA